MDKLDQTQINKPQPNAQKEDIHSKESILEKMRREGRLIEIQLSPAEAEEYYEMHA